MSTSSARNATRQATGGSPGAGPSEPRLADVRLTDWQFRDAMEHFDIGTAFVSLEGRWLHVNRALRELLGYDDDELSRLTFQDLTHPDDLNADLEQLDRLLAGEISAYRMEKRYLRKDGETVWALLCVSLVRDEQRTPQYFISQVIDINERKAAELERQVLTERLTLATKAGGIGVWDWDLRNDRMTCDARMFQLYGQTATETTTLGGAFLAAAHPDDAERINERVRTALLGEPNYDVEFRVVHPSGEVRDLRGAAEILRDETGTPVRVVGITWDTTDLRRLADDARTASEAKSRFLATMSHEIRTPLNGVLGMAQVLASDPDLSKAQRGRVSVIQESGEALLAILNDVLDLTKIESGKLELEETVFDLGRVLECVRATFASIAEDKDVALTVALGAAAGAYRGDPTRLRQIVSNLISNALKFTAEGEVKVTAQPSADGVTIRVSDTGMGIPPDALDKVFGAFTQADSSVTRLHGGTGLGLAICRELSGLMGGELSVESEVGHGTTFRLEIPLVRVAEAAAGPSDAYAPTSLQASALRVLVAEDNATNQLVLAALLAQVDVTPVSVCDGQQAIEAWRAQDWDIILMDVQMPVLDGLSATRTIRAEEAESRRKRTIIVALTANAMPQQVAAYREAGMDGFVPKPIDVRALLTALELAAAA
ncbi:PAS domain S-box protein [Phenylobacterium sp. LjRoot225]|uniref:PAS domain S-box protein n=1 Tax=Phenylobacterium sp. LjRoot225 TaxID=3342285 RepID=UPI003ECD1D18